MGKKYEKLKKAFTWKKEAEYNKCASHKIDPMQCVLVKLANGDIYKGRYSVFGEDWFVYVEDFTDNNYIEERVKDNNPVVEWCIMPFEPESQEENVIDKSELLDNKESDMGKKYDELKEHYTWKLVNSQPPKNGFYVVLERACGIPKTGYYREGKWYAASEGFDDDAVIYPIVWCYLPMDRERIFTPDNQAVDARDKYKARIEALERALCDIAAVVAKTCDI